MDHRDRRCRVRRSYRDLQIEFDPVRPSHADCRTIAVVTAKKEQGAKPCSLHFKALILAFITLGARRQRIPRRGLGSPKTWTAASGLAYSAELSNLAEIERYPTAAPLSSRFCQRSITIGASRTMGGPVAGAIVTRAVQTPGWDRVMLFNCQVPSGKWAALRAISSPVPRASSVSRTSLAGNSEKSSRKTRIMALACPARPGSIVTSAMASLV